MCRDHPVRDRPVRDRPVRDRSGPTPRRLWPTKPKHLAPTTHFAAIDFSRARSPCTDRVLIQPDRTFPFAATRGPVATEALVHRVSQSRRCAIGSSSEPLSSRNGRNRTIQSAARWLRYLSRRRTECGARSHLRPRERAARQPFWRSVAARRLRVLATACVNHPAWEVRTTFRSLGN